MTGGVAGVGGAGVGGAGVGGVGVGGVGGLELAIRLSSKFGTHCSLKPDANANAKIPKELLEPPATSSNASPDLIKK